MTVCVHDRGVRGWWVQESEDRGGQGGEGGGFLEGGGGGGGGRCGCVGVVGGRGGGASRRAICSPGRQADRVFSYGLCCRVLYSLCLVVLLNVNASHAVGYRPCVARVHY